VYLSNTTISLLQLLKTFKSHHTCHTFCSITDASEEAFVRVSEWWKSYSISDCILNIKESTDMLHSVALNGCWKKLCLKANDIQGFPNQEGNVRNINVLTYDVPVGFLNLEEAYVQEVPDPHGAELIEFCFLIFYVGHPIVMKIHNV
jgi:hypothetical protein